MIANTKKLSLIFLAFIMLVGKPDKVEAITFKEVGDAAINSGVALTAVTAATALIYYYRLHLFVGLSGLEKRLNLQGFATSASIRYPKKRPFKWYHWRLIEHGGWFCAQDIKKNEKAVLAALHNDLQQFIMAQEHNILFNNLIELKKDGVVYHPISIRNNGNQREFGLEVYSVVKRAMANELQELRNYLWLCQSNIHSIKILSEIEIALKTQRQPYRAHFITRIEDIRKLSRVEFESIRGMVSRSMLTAQDTDREQKALYLFFEVLERYARLYQIDECVGEYIAAHANGQKWPVYDRTILVEKISKQILVK